MLLTETDSVLEKSCRAMKLKGRRAVARGVQNRIDARIILLEKAVILQSITGERIVRVSGGEREIRGRRAFSRALQTPGARPRANRSAIPIHETRSPPENN